MKRYLAVFVLGLALAPRPASAQVDQAGVTCHASPLFFVVGREREGEPGTDFIVLRKAQPDQAFPCKFDEASADYRIGKPGEPLNFEALGGKYLVLAASTGPSATLIVHDLDARKQMLSARLTEANETTISGDTVRVTLRTGKATAKTCKDLTRFRKDGGTGELGVPATFDMATGVLTRGKSETCTYAQ